MREKSIAWWNTLSEINKINLSHKYTKRANFSTLTGREIEKIYTFENSEIDLIKPHNLRKLL